ncbi:hypothetical protein ABMZ67_23555 [Pseudomonas aeruginosa]|uniref:hypothetical protein n=1 Tax=Pseudomonas TaxID=286 RepID=UPI00044E0D11|nr:MULTISPECIES: hypothetical protein [Pseudomonas]EJB8390320.1 hypothetical protein [Pseudomonas aeruginosa]ELK4745131.1 hypothetical protein [Pseudomonas aeruginosa]EMB2837829.1 hypothetical protein [Pseudomonas aeruginosa]EZN57785.1 hypothetical protein AJ73_00572 [Pseudomonas aeruginosa BWH033]MBA5105978.1 hypothetical protein [Pseudomonas aeruginosa]
MPQPRRRIPESFKREAVNQVLPGTPRRHVSLSLATFLAVEASNRKSPIDGMSLTFGLARIDI